MNFYTNVKQWGNQVLYRGFVHGKKVSKKIDYKPVLYVPSSENSPYKTIFGENLNKIKFDSIKDSKEFLKKYSGVENFKIYGNTSYEYCVLSELFPEDVSFDSSKIRIAIFDIETNSDPETGGFASPENPFQPIISIALKFMGEKHSYLFGVKDFDAPEEVIYFKCKDEYSLCKKFIEIWSLDYPDIVSGWNCSSYDIPYIINRFNLIISEQETKKLSPWNIIQEKKNRTFVKALNKYVEEITFKIAGISVLDYILLYKKFESGDEPKESYKLDYIAEIEINENKLEYDGSLHKLYIEDTNTFYKYNIKDVDLVERIENKCKLLQLALTLAYDSKVNYEDVFQQTRMWDTLIFNHLRKDNIQIPLKETFQKIEYEGAFVKPPNTGKHNWVVSIDGTSLYPNIMASLNISPETLISPEQLSIPLCNIKSQNITVQTLIDKAIDLSVLKDECVSMAPNKTFYRTDKRGFLFDMIVKMFDERKRYKKTMIELQTFKEKIIDEIKSRSI